MPVEVQCKTCGKKELVIPARAAKYQFCSLKCAGIAHSQKIKGDNHPRWKGGEREKTCPQCGNIFRWEDMRHLPAITWEQRKFCSNECAVKGQIRYEGENHPYWKPNSRRKVRRGKHRYWASAVLARDNSTCQHCGVKGVEMHAHHIKPISEAPELKFELSNGLTLCYECHWKVHSASNANAVNSVKPLTDNAEGNTEPSSQRKLIEGVTTRGRAYRRFDTTCEQCGKPISKDGWSAKNNAHLFCSRSCASKWRVANGVTTFGKRNGSKASTSAAPERDDIV